MTDEDGAQRYIREQMREIARQDEEADHRLTPIERMSRGFAENDNARKREQQEENHE